MDKQYTVCFTGHRQIPENPAEVEARVSAIIETLIQRGYSCFCAGGARGFDLLAAKAVLQSQARYPFVRLVLVLPFQNQYRHSNRGGTAYTVEYAAKKGLEIIRCAAD